MPSAAKSKPAKPRRGDLLELRVERIAHGGAGVARDDGFVVFVEGGYPGDRVRAEVVRSKRDFANARVVDVLEPSDGGFRGRATFRGREYGRFRLVRR
jgi:23S rRNA (uracil1939-C5)-methyltransferase